MIEIKTVGEVVDENHACAYVLDCYGIEFFKHQSKTIGEVCLNNKLCIEHVSHNLQAIDKDSDIDIALLKSYPVDLVVEYLKHAHHIFIKKSLPYVGKLIRNLKPECHDASILIEDLKTAFPLFAEDFIHHIYEEEDELFYYVQLLTQVSEKRLHHHKIYDMMEKVSLKNLAQSHDNADDEMRGIRILTNNYRFGVNADLHLKTIYRELRQFEKELVFHANVENEVLFPKAIDLEAAIKEELRQLSGLN